MKEPDQNGDNHEGLGKASEAVKGLLYPRPSSASQGNPQSQDVDSSDLSDVHSDTNEPAGSVSHMMRLFAPPTSNTTATKDLLSSEPTAWMSPKRHNRMDSFVAGQDSPERQVRESAPLLGGNGFHTPQSSISSMADLDKTPKTNMRTYGGIGGNSDQKNDPTGHARRVSATGHFRMPSVAMPSISEGQVQTILAQPSLRTVNNTIAAPNQSEGLAQGFLGRLFHAVKSIACSIQPTTYIGSFVFLLYHVVFCLALGSAIMRPNSSVSILGLMTKTAALGTLAASPIYWIQLSQEVPALYPTGDLFLAPFLAKLALIVDQTLSDDPEITDEENDAVFLASFGVLTALGIAFSSFLIMAASVFKLANMGSFLPYPVICGFFAAVGILTWTLAVNVDTGGKSIGTILSSGDFDLIRYALLHHVPTIVVAGFMKYLGPKNPFFVCLVVIVTIALFYIFMLVTGTTLEEMKQEGWFWSHEELVYENYSSTLGFEEWVPPAPFGVFVVINQVHWESVWNGFSTTIALSFLYLIRCSVHGAALKKNISNLSRKVSSNDPVGREPVSSDDLDNDSRRSGNPGMLPKPSIRSRKFSEAVDIEAVMALPFASNTSNNINNLNGSEEDEQKYQIIQPKSTNISLKTISLSYAWSQLCTAVVGGFAVTPLVAASPTMYVLGAESLAPQVGAVLLLLVFYLTDFQIVGYIPKPAFSSMLVLSFFDMTHTWAYNSFFKTKDKLEWMVVPAIIVCAFAIDLLSAVFLGIAFSTFIFVAAFFRSGVVKYVANGQTIHSTIERPLRMSEWLNANGNRIQVICLQNYLFFGNASSVYNYVFEVFRVNAANNKSAPENQSKFLILDLTLVTGMDTSAVDVFSQIRGLCKGSNCKLFMAGMSTNIRSILSLGGFKPDTGVRAKRQVRFFGRLDAALGKAEDILVESDYEEQTVEIPTRSGMRRVVSRKDSGFLIALRYIDTEVSKICVQHGNEIGSKIPHETARFISANILTAKHGDNFSHELARLEKYTMVLELKPGEALYGDGKSRSIERGLFFIESGVLKLERGTGDTLTRRGLESMICSGSLENTTATKPNILPPGIALNTKDSSESESFRLARLGVGWVAGTMEFFHMERPGTQVALDHCRLHHLPFSKIQEAELEDPGLVLKLYKLLSYMMAQRQEATIGQLATLHSIMSSPAR